MYASFDRHSPANLSADVFSLSWKGDSRQGWLAAGNSRKTVGVTYTEVKDWEDDSWEADIFSSEVALERQGMRRNFNFREHSSEVRASCAVGFAMWLGPRCVCCVPSHPAEALSRACFSLPPLVPIFIPRGHAPVTVLSVF